MKNNITDINFLFPEEPEMDGFVQIPQEEPFSENALEFLNAFSHILNKDPETKNYPDIATFAFYCRKANLIQLKKKYYPEDARRLGRGVVFHITPSNVPVNFAYSLISGILSGNTNIVRVPSKNFKQVEIICNAIYKLSRDPKYHSYSSRQALVCYDRQSSATAYFSSLCDVRIIWGSDETINEIKKSNLPSRAFDVTFSDRYSLCIINADAYINEKSPKQIASGFYNDTYFFDQNACTSPHLIIWLGQDRNVETAKRIFWNNLYDLVKSKYNLQPISAVDKLTVFYNQAVHLEGVKKIVMPDNLIWRTELKEISKYLEKYRCNCGYFIEYKASSYSEISEIISRKYQTISYYGIEKEDLYKFIEDFKLNGIDRIVTIGKTTDFSLTWDGFNLIDTLSREYRNML